MKDWLAVNAFLTVILVGLPVPVGSSLHVVAQRAWKKCWAERSISES